MNTKVMVIDIDQTMLEDHFFKTLQKTPMSDDDKRSIDTAYLQDKQVAKDGVIVQRREGETVKYFQNGKDVSDNVNGIQTRINDEFDKFGGSGAIKNPERMRDCIRNALQNGVKVALGSYTHFPGTAEPLLKALGLDEDEIKQIVVVGGYPSGGADREATAKHGKQEHIAAIKEELMRRYPGITINDKDILLADDTSYNINKAYEDGHQTAQVDLIDKSNTSYLEIMENFINRADLRQDESQNQGYGQQQPQQYGQQPQQYGQQPQQPNPQYGGLSKELQQIFDRNMRRIVDSAKSMQDIDNFLHQHGRQLLASDGKTPAIDNIRRGIKLLREMDSSVVLSEAEQKLLITSNYGLQNKIVKLLENERKLQNAQQLQGNANSPKHNNSGGIRENMGQYGNHYQGGAQNNQNQQLNNPQKVDNEPRQNFPNPPQAQQNIAPKVETPPPQNNSPILNQYGAQNQQNSDYGNRVNNNAVQEEVIREKVAKAESMQDIYAILQRYDNLKNSRNEFALEGILKGIEALKNASPNTKLSEMPEINEITSKYGLRDKIVELMEKERKLQNAPQTQERATSSAQRNKSSNADLFSGNYFASFVPSASDYNRDLTGEFNNIRNGKKGGVLNSFRSKIKSAIDPLTNNGRERQGQIEYLAQTLANAPREGGELQKNIYQYKCYEEMKESISGEKNGLKSALEVLCERKMSEVKKNIRRELKNASKNDPTLKGISVKKYIKQERGKVPSPTRKDSAQKQRSSPKYG